MTTPSSPTTAVVGSGVAGLTAAYLLARRGHDVALYEADSRLGGHAHTHVVGTEQGEIAVDSGFIVHNSRTYPNLSRLLKELGIQTRPTEMSMSITHEKHRLEYAGGRGLRGIVATPIKSLAQQFPKVLLQVPRFYRLATRFLEETDTQNTTTYAEFLRDHRFSNSFIALYATPIVACVWSTSSKDALDYPAHYLFSFLRNHGLLSLRRSYQWKTIVGGSIKYVDAIARALPRIHLNSAVRTILRSPSGVRLTLHDGSQRKVDRVIIATHADEALRLLADPTQSERGTLGAFRYSRNEAILHSDSALMPSSHWAKASWNYRIPPNHERNPPLVTYWMNRLMRIDGGPALFVSLNADGRVSHEKIIARTHYDHPIYDPHALSAQRRLDQLATRTTVYAGAYHGWGFHEDGCRSGVRAAEHFGAYW